jgi:hypothetical protein
MYLLIIIIKISLHIIIVKFNIMNIIQIHDIYYTLLIKYYSKLFIIYNIHIKIIL